jgi:hypothetical protein
MSSTAMGTPAFRKFSSGTNGNTVIPVGHPATANPPQRNYSTDTGGGMNYKTFNATDASSDDQPNPWSGAFTKVRFAV